MNLGSDGLPVGRCKQNYRNNNGIVYKRCAHCGEFLRLRYFYPLKYRRNGKEYETLQSWCRFCMATEIGRRAKLKRANT